jgi:hypothetical protein
VLYVALGCFISYLPYNPLAKMLSGGIGARGDRLVDIHESDSMSPDDQRHTTALIQQTVEKRLAEKFL